MLSSLPHFLVNLADPLFRFFRPYPNGKVVGKVYVEAGLQGAKPSILYFLVSLLVNLAELFNWSWDLGNAQPGAGRVSQGVQE